MRAWDFYRRRLDNVIASVKQPRTKRSYDDEYEKLLDGPCLIHKNSNHTMRHGYGLAKAYRDEGNKRSKKHDDRKHDGHKDPKHPKDTNKDFQDEDKTVGTIFGGVAAAKNR